MSGGDAVVALGGRFGRHALVYAATSAVQLVFALGTVAVTTRYLEPSDYGHFAVLLFAASLLTLVANAGSLQGTFAVSFGSLGDDDVADEASEAPATADRRRAFATGLLATFVIASLLAAPAVAAAGPLAGLLVGDADRAQLVRLAAAAGVATALWRLLANSLRLERRPLAYAATTVAMAIAVLTATWLLLAAGEGLEGAVAGQAIGATAAALLAAALARRNVRLAASLSDARAIARAGRPMIPVVFSVQTIQLADVFLISRVAPASSVGVYRVASRVGALVSYFTSALHMAWGPLRRDPLHVAADARHGRTHASAAVTTAFVGVSVWAVLVCAVLAEWLVRIAPGAYQEARDIVPLTALAFAAHAWFVLLYRTSEHRDKRRWFIRLCVLCAVVFAATAIPLINWLGAGGAPVGAISGWTVGMTGFLLLNARAADRGPYRWSVMAGVMLVAAAAYGAFRLLWSAGAPPALVAVLAVVAYPAALIVAGVLPMTTVRTVVAMVLSIAPRGAPSGLDGLAAAGDPAGAGAVLDLVVRRRLAPEAVARMAGVPDDVVYARAVRGLRLAAGDEAPDSPADADVGRYLLAAGAFGDRQAIGDRLLSEGVDPLAVEALERRLKALRRRRR